MFDGLKFEPDPSCVRAGFRNRLYEGNDHTAETSTPRQCRALAGRCVLHPPHFAMLFLSAEPANSWIVRKPETIRKRAWRRSMTISPKLTYSGDGAPQLGVTRERTIICAGCWCKRHNTCSAGLPRTIACGAGVYSKAFRTATPDGSVAKRRARM